MWLSITVEWIRHVLAPGKHKQVKDLTRGLECERLNLVPHSNHLCMDPESSMMIESWRRRGPNALHIKAYTVHVPPLLTINSNSLLLQKGALVETWFVCWWSFTSQTNRFKIVFKAVTEKISITCSCYICSPKRYDCTVVMYVAVCHMIQFTEIKMGQTFGKKICSTAWKRTKLEDAEV